ncbi:MAG: type II toxin-antitoxin system YoeB family toxin [Spirochaetaceae bacterium]|nr:type II toxin-antitoxin system YoeB family toxin [Spirochaetaceae bacterium]
MDPNRLDDLEHWVPTDRRRALRTLRLIEAVLRDPFEAG